MRGLKRIVDGSLSENCYVMAGPRGEALAIDPGDGSERVAEHLRAQDLNLQAILLTHGHDDHVATVAELAELTGAPVHLHSDDATVLRWASMSRVVIRKEPPFSTPTIDVDLARCTRLRFGALEATVVHTPGHTPGSVCFELGGELFTGDTVFAEHVGRTDLREGNRDALEASLRLLAERYPPQTAIHPGHGEEGRLSEILPRILSLPELR